MRDHKTQDFFYCHGAWTSRITFSVFKDAAHHHTSSSFVLTKDGLILTYFYCTIIQLNRAEVLKFFSHYQLGNQLLYFLLYNDIWT